MHDVRVCIACAFSTTPPYSYDMADVETHGGHGGQPIGRSEPSPGIVKAVHITTAGYASSHSQLSLDDLE